MQFAFILQCGIDIYLIIQVNGQAPDEELKTKPDHDNNLKVVEHLPGLVLVLLDGGEDGEGETHEDEAEDESVIAESHLTAGSLQEVIDDGLGLLDPRVPPARLEPDWLAQQTGPLLVVSSIEGRVNIKCQLRDI